MTTMRVMAILLSAVSTLLTLAPLLRVKTGFVRVWDFPRPQIAAAALLSVVLILIH